jgi:hypothetical protein
MNQPILKNQKNNNDTKIKGKKGESQFLVMEKKKEKLM